MCRMADLSCNNRNAVRARTASAGGGGGGETVGCLRDCQGDAGEVRGGEGARGCSRVLKGAATLVLQPQDKAGSRVEDHPVIDPWNHATYIF